MSSTKQRGQPGVADTRKKWKDILFTAICADGSCLPPLIVTSDTKLKNLTYGKAKVILIRGNKGQSNIATQAWVDNMQEYLQDNPLLLLDNHKCHYNKEMVSQLNDMGASIMYFPAHLGGLLNPCDNSFHSILKRYYFGCKRDTHEEMIKAIIDSYFAVTEKQIVNFFHHTGIISKTPARQVARRLLGEGYLHPNRHGTREMLRQFNLWRNHPGVLRGKARKLG